jgi:DNA polymerase III subunit gamma/tau
MTFILAQEAIASDVAALKLIARAADGSMRDGLSLLDQAIVFGNGSVRADDVRDMLGTIAQQPVEDILTALAAGDANSILNIINNISELSPDFGGVLTQILQVLHRIALLQAVPAAIDDEFDTEMLAALAAQFTPEEVQLYYQIALMGQKDLDLAPDPRSGFEMVMLRLLAFKPIKVESFSHKNRVPVVNVVNTNPSPEHPKVHEPVIEATASPVAINTSPIKSASNPVYTQVTEPPTQIQEPSVSHMPSPFVHPTDNWADMIEAMGLNALTRELANNCVLESIDDNLCTLIIDPDSTSIRSARTEDGLLKALQNYRGSQIKLLITAQKSAVATPALKNIKDRENRQQVAVDAIHSDVNILALQEQFGAQVIPNSIEPR